MCCGGFVLASASASAAPAIDVLDAVVRDRWNTPVEPFRIVGDTWYVGTRGLTVLALRTNAGVILIDAALPESVPQILANLAALGIAPGDIRILLSSHAHFDHAGGLAELKARTGAELIATDGSAALLARGGRGDLHYGDAAPFPAVQTDRRVGDQEVVRLGGHELTALATPGHTPGSTTWTWREIQGGQSHTVVYADSLTAPGYRLAGNPRYPHIVEDFLRSADRIAELPCDVLLAPHPDAAGLFDRLARRTNAAAPLTGEGDCARYAARARASIERIVLEQAEQPLADPSARPKSERR